MIQRLSHMPVFVLDHDTAIEFYAGKLGFRLTADSRLDNGYRWVTVQPPNQPDLEIALVLVEERDDSPMTENTVELLDSLVQSGALAGGVFCTDDCRATYAELSARGVKFTKPPVPMPYGIEAVFEDPFGNWFTLIERPGP